VADEHAVGAATPRLALANSDALHHGKFSAVHSIVWLNWSSDKSYLILIVSRTDQIVRLSFPRPFTVRFLQ
jgi:hypothetical protein